MWVGVLQIVKGVMWAFEQPQNLAGSNVHTNIRMTAVKMSDGQLLIYAPVAPTRWCCRQGHDPRCVDDVKRVKSCRKVSDSANVVAAL